MRFGRALVERPAVRDQTEALRLLRARAAMPRNHADSRRVAQTKPTRTGLHMSHPSALRHDLGRVVVSSSVRTDLLK